jgi:hypothetical protein
MRLQVLGGTATPAARLRGARYRRYFARGYGRTFGALLHRPGSIYVGLAAYTGTWIAQHILLFWEDAPARSPTPARCERSGLDAHDRVVGRLGARDPEPGVHRVQGGSESSDRGRDIEVGFGELGDHGSRATLGRQLDDLDPV